MPEISTLLLFAATTFLVAITPGPDQIYIATRSMAQGFGAGLVSALGIYTGIVLHIVAVVLGLSVVLAASPLAFGLMQVGGSSYLIYLGIRTLLQPSPKNENQKNNSPENTLALESLQPIKLSKIYLDGIIINVLNPKAMLFFLALLPQFVDPNLGNIRIQMLYLGLVAIAVGFPVDAGIGLLFATLKQWLYKHKRIRGLAIQLGKWFTGLIFIALGLNTAISFFK